MNVNYIPLIVAQRKSATNDLLTGKQECAVYSPPSVQKASPIQRGNECWRLETDYEELLRLRQAVLRMELAKSSRDSRTDLKNVYRCVSAVTVRSVRTRMPRLDRRGEGVG